MRVTKYEHACLDITEGTNRLVIDPGELSPSFTDVKKISLLVVTHVHGDHLDLEKVDAIVSENPDLKIFATSEVAGKLKGRAVTVPEPGKLYSAGPFNLEFFGELHEMVDPKTPQAQNIGVLVNDKLYYPGDSFVLCKKPFSVLAVPKSGPWFRVSDALLLFENSNCQLVFPTHDGLLNEIGHGSINNWFKLFAERNNKEYHPLKIGESLEI
jgi:L-ascorbate metabolism protein UlaG (beta-lactamase superfamily)